MLPSRRTLRAVGMVVVGVAAVAWLARGGDAPTTAVAKVPSAAGKAAAASPPVDRRAVSSASAPALAAQPGRRTAPATVAPNLARSTAEDYRRRARYPRSSHPLA